MPAASRKQTGPQSVLGQQVRALRQKKGWSQQHLGQVAGLSRATVAAVELGRYQGIESQTLEKLAAALGCTIATMLETPRRDVQVPQIASFVDSTWYEAIACTPEELAWLHSLPLRVWRGVSESGQVAAELIAWRRRHLV